MTVLCLWAGVYMEVFGCRSPTGAGTSLNHSNGAIWRSGSSMGVEKIPGWPLVDEWYCPRLLSRLACLPLFFGIDSSISHLFFWFQLLLLAHYTIVRASNDLLTSFHCSAGGS
jgi:hypothetical protein